VTRPRSPAPPWQRIHDAIYRRTAHLPPTVRGLLWSASAGLIFSVLNALMRALALHLDPFQAQFLRYLFGLLVLLPLVARSGSLRAWWPKSVRGQFVRGALHTAGLVLWFLALPRIPLADMTAIGFTGPLFIMVGAWLFFKEPMHWERWVAVGLGFAGVLIVVGPRLSIGQGGGGLWHLVMLASAPLFAASFLVTKALTRYETAGTILLWQANHGHTAEPAAGPARLAGTHALAVGGFPGLRGAGQCRALLPDALVPGGRHLRPRSRPSFSICCGRP
jgi:drug/metabolite transporter (DMT)-like permease